jgi:hypothetical protein
LQVWIQSWQSLISNLRPSRRKFDSSLGRRKFSKIHPRI